MLFLTGIILVQCFVRLIVSLPAYKPYEIVFQGETGMMTHTLNLNEGSSISIYCQDHIRMTDAFPSSNVTLSFKFVYIGQCVPRNSTYLEEFKALNMNTSIINALTHVFNMKEPLPSGDYTKDLNLDHLVIVNDQADFEYVLNNTPNYFEPLTNLKTMYVSSLQIPPLPKTTELVNLSLASGSSLTKWGNCEHLEHFSLSSFKKSNFPEWPQNCAKLKILEIEYLEPNIAEMVTERMVAAAPSLNTLKITYCRLHKLPSEIIRNAKNLVYLDLSDNMLYDELFQSFPFHPTIRTLFLNSNLIRGHGLGSLVTKLPGLLDLGLRYENKFIGTCAGSNLRTKFIEPFQNSSIEFLDLGPTEIHLDCFKGIRYSNLKRITLLYPVTSSPDSELKLIDLPQSNAGLEVDFDHWRFTRILFDEEDYETLRNENSTLPYQGRNQTVLVKNVPCNCQHGLLARALRDFPHMISMPTLLCDHDYGIPILEVPRDQLECDLMDGDDGCVYRKSWDDGSVTADCDLEAWSKMEYMYPLKGLNVSGQGLSTLHAKLPDMLQWLDLRRNIISRGDSEQAAALFAGGRRVWLADNLLLCECDNHALLDAIQQHQHQVQDYDLLRCVGTGETLSSISTSVLCQVAFIVSLSACGVLIVIVGVLAVLLRRHGEQLRMFLYSRGWCISCLRKHDLDDKPYDAFISFAHEDREYVMNTLLPGLEEGPERFRVCVHYRDWLVGDWIPAQIMRSVQTSKRTLILLSRNFVASTWSTLELRYALANLAEEPNAKVLILVTDDVLDMDLDVELNKYITYNTYLSCDDPWFWEKLRYAMPHRVKNKTSGNVDSGARVEQINMENVTECRPEQNT